MNNCRRLVATATPTVTEGATVALDITNPTTAPEFSQCIAFRIAPAPLDPTTGQEVCTLTIGGVTGQIVGNCGETIPAQMIADALCHNPCNVFVVQFGVQGTTSVFYARRGFARRKTYSVAPAAAGA